MIEYLYNAIRATAGEDISIAAKIVSDSGIPVENSCHLVLYDNQDNILTKIDGALIDETWQFTIPAAITADIRGRYWYCICNETHNKLSFKQPIYLV